MWRFIYWQRYPHYGWTIGPRRSGQGFFHNSYGMHKNMSFLVRKYFKMKKNILLRRSEGTEPTLRAVAGELEKRNQCGLQTSYEARYRFQWTKGQGDLHWDPNLLTLGDGPYQSTVWWWKNHGHETFQSAQQRVCCHQDHPR